MLLDEIKKTIMDEYKAHATQEDIAKKYNVSQSYIANLIAGKRNYGDMALKTFLKMFPSATTDLHGTGNISGNTVSGNGNAVGHSNVVVNNPPSQDCVKSVIEVIINNDELSDEERGKFIRIIKAAVLKETKEDRGQSR